jgi:hypothetical protein
MSDTEKPGEGAAASSATPHADVNARLYRWLVQAASLAALRGEAAAVARRASLRAALTAAAGLAWALVAGFLLAAFVVWLSGKVGTILACAIVAVGFAVIALVLHFAASRLARQQPWARLKAHIREMVDSADETTGEGAIGALALVALAGFVLGARGRRR